MYINLSFIFSLMCLIFSSLLGERINPTGYCPIDRGPRYLRFNVLILEDAKACHLLMSM